MTNILYFGAGVALVLGLLLYSHIVGVLDSAHDAKRHIDNKFKTLDDYDTLSRARLTQLENSIRELQAKRNRRPE